MGHPVVMLTVVLSFANRCTEAWNSLNNDVVLLSFVQAFKIGLIEVDLSNYCYVL